MWNLFFTIVLLAGGQASASIWTGRKTPSVLSMGLSAAAGLLVGIAALFVNNGIMPAAVLIGHTVYVISEAAHRRATDALAAVLLCLDADMLLIPFALCDEDMKSYSFYGLVILLSLIFAGLYKKNGMSEQWLAAVKESSVRVYAVLCCMPVLSAAVQALVLLLYRPYGDIMTTIGVYVLFIFITASAVLIQRLCAEHFTLAESNRNMQEWQQEAGDYMNTIRSQRHDFNIHLHAIDGMIENKEYEQCRRYVSKMVEEANAVNDIMPVYDAMIGSMLYNMRREAQRLGSDIYYDIKYDMKNVVCNAFECNKIIGNLIRNSIDALDSEAAKKQGISVNIFRRSGNAVITVSNYFNGDPQTVLNAFELNYSTKSGHEGIGLAMIEKTLKKYGGRIMAEWQEQCVSFIVHIPVRYIFEEEKQERSGES